MTSSMSYPGPSMQLAREFFALAKEEFQSPNILRQCDGCEKAYRAATEAVDVLLFSKGEPMPIGSAYVHTVRGDALYRWGQVDPRIKRLDEQYTLYKDKLHGLCFYSFANPLVYKNLFFSVEEFLTTITELVNEER